MKYGKERQRLCIHIFIISLMLAIGFGFFFWGTALQKATHDFVLAHNKVGHPLKIQKAKKRKASNATEPVPMQRLQN